MLILSGVIALFYSILHAHVITMFRLSVEAGTLLVVDVGRRIHPDLTVTSTGCRGRGCNRSLGAVQARSSGCWSWWDLSSGPMSMCLFRRGRRRGAWTRRSVLRKG